MEEFAQDLDEICSTFVLENPFGTLKLFSNINSEDGNEHPFILNKAMARVISKKNLPNDCRNCKHDPCLDGEYITRENFVVNAVILPNSIPNGEDPPIVRRT